MELNGALSNHFSTDKCLLISLEKVHHSLLDRAALEPRPARPAPSKRDPVLETVTHVLECARHPLRVPEIRAAAGELIGMPLNPSSVNAALSANSAGPRKRFDR